MKKILVPTDYSDLSGYPLTLAEKFARQSGIEIITLRVVPTPADSVFDRNGELLDREDYDRDAVKVEQALASSQLTSWLEKTGGFSKLFLQHISSALVNYANYPVLTFKI